jgi:hypothetical protein
MTHDRDHTAEIGKPRISSFSVLAKVPFQGPAVFKDTYAMYFVHTVKALFPVVHYFFWQNSMYACIMNRSLQNTVNF